MLSFRLLRSSFWWIHLLKDYPFLNFQRISVILIFYFSRLHHLLFILFPFLGLKPDMISIFYSSYYARCKCLKDIANFTSVAKYIKGGMSEDTYLQRNAFQFLLICCILFVYFCLKVVVCCIIFTAFVLFWCFNVHGSQSFQVHWPSRVISFWETNGILSDFLADL